MRRISALCLSLMIMGTAANATTLAAGGLYGGPTQGAALCYFFNAGNGTVSISGKQIFREGSGSVALTVDNCFTLVAGGICRFASTITSGATHACEAVVTPDGAHVRGTLEIRTNIGPGGTPLQTEQLR